MKKTIIGGILLSSLLLSACGNPESSGGASPSEQTTENTIEATLETTADAEEETNATEEDETSTAELEVTGINFEDNLATLEEIDIQITRHAVIQPGEAGNEYGEAPVIAFWYDTTNKTGENVDPTTAWIMTFDAIQDNDPNMVNDLEIASLPDDQYRDTQLNTIKQGGTLSNAVAYTLTDTTTPVTLVATEGLLGDEIGRQDFAIE